MEVNSSNPSVHEKSKAEEEIAAAEKAKAEEEAAAAERAKAEEETAAAQAQLEKQAAEKAQLEDAAEANTNAEKEAAEAKAEAEKEGAALPGKTADESPVAPTPESDAGLPSQADLLPQLEPLIKSQQLYRKKNLCFAGIGQLSPRKLALMRAKKPAPFAFSLEHSS